MEKRLKLPVGIEDFREIRNGKYYYVDKTALIGELLDGGNKVSLFTRPRRFGKSLNMSMLRSFFEIGTDRSLFDGLHAIRTAVSVGGDSDTIAAICGGIAELYYGVPISMRSTVKDAFLDKRLRSVLEEFERAYPPKIMNEQ